MPYGLVLLLAILLPSADAASATDSDLMPCELTGSRGIEAIDAECMDFEVPENPTDADGARIRLRVAVIRSPSPGS